VLTRLYQEAEIADRRNRLMMGVVDGAWCV
jgi:hypothetical protein